MDVLSNKVVQRELSLTTEQSIKAAKLYGAIRKLQPQPSDLQGKRGDDRLTIVKQKRNAANEAAEKVLKEFLSPDQYKRLHQIFFQANLLEGFTDFVDAYPGLDDLRRTIQLSDKQKSELRALSAEFRSTRNKLVTEGQRTKSPDIWKRVYDLRNEYQNKALDKLTDSQRTSWREIIGHPFDLDKVFRVAEKK